MTGPNHPLASSPRLIPAASWLYLALLLALVAVLAWIPVYPYCDFWVHAAAGRWTLEHGDVPRQNLFVWTAEGHPWTDHIWLSQVIFYWLARLGGTDDGAAHVAIVFTAGMACLPFALAWLCWRRRACPGIVAVITCYLVVEVSRGRFLPRPELFTTVGVATLLVLLAAWGKEPSRRQVWGVGAMLAVLFGVWANLHGAFIIGLLLLAATAVCDWWQYRDRGARWLAGLAGIAVVATFVNPYGPGIYRALLLTQSRTFETLQEWKPLWGLNPFPWGVLAKHAVLLGLALLAWGLNPARRLAHLAWLLLGVGLFAWAVRNGAISALICLVVTADNARSFDAARIWQSLTRGKRGPLPALPGVLLGATVVAWLSLQLWVRVLDVQDLAQTPSPVLLDSGAVHFMKEHTICDPGLCDYEASSYLQWRMAGDPPLFIDMMNVYPDAVSDDFDHIAAITRRGRELLARGDIGWVLLTSLRPPGAPSLAPLADHLDASPDWLRVYHGQDGVVWVRRTPGNAERFREQSAAVRRGPFVVLEVWVAIRLPLP